MKSGLSVSKFNEEIELEKIRYLANLRFKKLEYLVYIYFSIVLINCKNNLNYNIKFNIKKNISFFPIFLFYIFIILINFIFNYIYKK